MTKLRLFLRNLVRAALNSLLGVCLLFVLSCSSSTKPTYLKKDIEQAIVDICSKEYKIHVKTKLVGSTLWVYFPVSGLLVKNSKPKKYTTRFNIEQLQVQLGERGFKVEYFLKPIPPKEESQEYEYNKDIIDKMYDIWGVLRRVIFSLDRTKEKEPQFYYFVTADIKDGFEISEIAYYLDLKKLSYGLMSTTEYQHRTPQDVKIDHKIIGDKEGEHLVYKDISLGDFIALQIEYRMRMEFEKSEAGKKFDIDKEVLKIVTYTIQAYDFKDFDEAMLDNLATNNKVILNKAAVFGTILN